MRVLESYQVRKFTAPLSDGTPISHDVYTQGEEGACVVIIQELPGIGPETLSLANTFVEQGYRVVLPHLFGPLERISLAGNLVRVFCMRRELTLFTGNKASPVVDWLKALCRDLKDNHGATGIGVIGMCLTGNFAISLMAEDSVLAGVASQPSMPVMKQDELHMSEQDVAEIRASLDEKGPMMALRFEGDPMCTGRKFAALNKAFNNGAERIRLIELPGKGHSVLTLDFIKGGEPARQALDQVLGYFAASLKA